MLKANLLKKFEQLPEHISDYSDNDWKIYHGKGDYDTLEELKALPKDTVIYTICDHVSQSGMMRHIEMFYMDIYEGKPQKRPIRFLTEEVFNYKIQRKTDKYHVGGCGMDMGFHLVNSLSYLVSSARSQDGKSDGYHFKQEWF